MKGMELLVILVQTASLFDCQAAMAPRRREGISWVDATIPFLPPFYQPVAVSESELTP